jgi:hypothetical protein
LKPIDIPDCNKIISIWDFLISFKSTTGFEINYSFEVLYNYISKKNKSTLANIYYHLVETFVLHIKDIDVTELSEDKQLLLIKVAADNVFTELNIFVKRSWPAIIKIIFNTRTFSILLDDKLRNILQKIENSSVDNFDEVLTSEEHIELIWRLINSLFETRKIRNAIKNEMDKKNNIMREKACLEIELYKLLI